MKYVISHGFGRSEIEHASDNLGEVVSDWAKSRAWCKEDCHEPISVDIEDEHGVVIARAEFKVDVRVFMYGVDAP